MLPIIRFDQVSVIAQEKPILSNVSFELYPGQKSVLFGKSGAGKSSVLRTLLGMHTIKSGTVYFQERGLSAQTVQLIRTCTAYIGQEPVLGGDSARDALLLPFRFKAHRNKLPSEAAIREVMERLKLPAELLNQDNHSISGGEKQRIALARGLLLGKTVYLLDEFTSALDNESKQTVFEVFVDPQYTVLSVSHDTEWAQYCDAVFNVEAGQVTRMGEYGNAGH